MLPFSFTATKMEYFLYVSCPIDCSRLLQHLNFQGFARNVRKTPLPALSWHHYPHLIVDKASGRLQYIWTFGVLVQCGIKGPQQLLLHSRWNCPDNASADNRKHHNQRRIVASPDCIAAGAEETNLIGGRMKALKRLVLLVTALAVTTAMVPQASSQTPPPAQQPPPAQPPPAEQPPPVEEQHNTHPVAKGAVAGAAFGAAAGATGGGGTTVVHTGSAHRSGSVNHQAKHHKTGKSRR
jgi:hypothetical protein